MLLWVLQYSSDFTKIKYNMMKDVTSHSDSPVLQGKMLLTLNQPHVITINKYMLIKTHLLNNLKHVLIIT